MKKKQLEFNIDGNLLEVADFTWLIDRINMIYVAPFSNNLGLTFTIYIATNNEIVKLYYESKKLEEVLSQYKKLCSAIAEVKQNFKEYAYIFFNLDNAKNFEHFYVTDEIKNIKGKSVYSAKVMAILKGGVSVNFILSGSELEDFKSTMNRQKEQSLTV